LVRLLQNAGFDAVPAANGAEALAYLQAGNLAHVIVLDAVMPVMDGWSFRRAQISDPWIADIPVVALSGVATRAARGLHATATFRKPVDIPSLIDTLRWIGHRAKDRRAR
jgi:CheY-like chemotaxis protein